MKLLEGKNVIVTGVMTKDSIAYHAAQAIIEHGGTVALTSFGRAAKLTDRASRSLDGNQQILEFDATHPEAAANLTKEIRAIGWDEVHGAVHSIGFTPQSTLGPDTFMSATWHGEKTSDDIDNTDGGIAAGIQTSAVSLQVLANAVSPLMKEGASIVGYDFDATVAWPVYSWMNVAKAALEAVNRNLALELGTKGIRSNLISAGPLRTTAATKIEGFSELADGWSDKAPLGWDLKGQASVGKTTVALLSDLIDATSGEIIHVDGGYHAVGA
ncbi:MAG: enoyl-ACP reductase FabI [Patescibacteria group bacterium]